MSLNLLYIESIFRSHGLSNVYIYIKHDLAHKLWLRLKATRILYKSNRDWSFSFLCQSQKYFRKFTNSFEFDCFKVDDETLPLFIHLPTTLIRILFLFSLSSFSSVHFHVNEDFISTTTTKKFLFKTIT